MKIVVAGKEIRLREKDVAIAQKVIMPFLNTVKAGASENNMPTLYITVLAILHAKTGELLASVNEQDLKKVMELLSAQEIKGIDG